MVILSGFGFWQLDRADEKQSLQNAINERSALAPLNFPNTALSISDLGSAQHRVGQVTGEYIADGQF